MRTKHQETAPKTELVDTHCFGGYDYIGLRAHVADAPERAIALGGSAPKHVHVLLRVKFNTPGIARCVTANEAGKHALEPIISKRVYSDHSRVWGVRHSIGDFPLDDSKQYVSTEWLHIE